jgi:hypothetical protein
MDVTFDELQIKTPGRSNPYPLEITLFPDITFNCRASSVPTAYGQDATSRSSSGMTLVGYVHQKTEDRLEISFDRLEGERQFTGIGGVHIYKDAIRRMKVLVSDEERK